MKLHFFHGREKLTDNLDDWGTNGPTLEGVKSFHMTYLCNLVVVLDTEENFKLAQEKTGWDVWDRGERSLSARIDQDCIWAAGSFYGDWTVEG